MQGVIILCAITLFVQIGSEHLNDIANNKLIGNDNILPEENKSEYKKCMLHETIRKIQEILRSQIKKSEFQIKSSLKPKENSTQDINSNNRTVRQAENLVQWDKCATRFELEQHQNSETEHILAIKKELGNLQELVRLLRDQQFVLNMLNDVEKPRPKTDDEIEQKQLMELFKMLKNNLPVQPKTEEMPLPPTNPNHAEFQSIMTEISKLQKQIENQNLDHGNQLKTELNNHKQHLQTLEDEIENLRSGQALFINVNPNNTNTNTPGPEVVGAKLSHANPLPAQLQTRRTSEIGHLHRQSNKQSGLIRNPKARADNDDFFENLQKLLLDTPEQTPQTKEDPSDLNTIPSNDIGSKLNGLEKQLRLSQKMKQLEKKIKQLQQSNVESKNIDDDQDLQSQIKKMQRQLDKMSKNKVQSKSLDEEDILDELKDLQNSINDLRPKEDQSQPKIGGAEIQFFLNKLIGVQPQPVVPVVPIATHSQLSPAQIQVLKRIMALKANSQQHVPSSQFGFGLDGTAVSGYGHSSALYNPAYSIYGPGFYNTPQPGPYNHGTYPPSKNIYSAPTAFYPAAENNKYIPYGPINHGPYDHYAYSNKYSNNPYPLNNAYSITPNYAPYGTASLKGGYNEKPSPYANIAQYLLGGGPYYIPNYSGPDPYSGGNHGYGPIPYAENKEYLPKNLYGTSTEDKTKGGSYNPSTKYPTTTTSYSKPYLYGTQPVTSSTNSRPNAYEEQRFFRGYQDAESTSYESDSPQPYSNSQENSYSGNSYSLQNMGELQTQIYKLQNIINNLNNPAYAQKPEDKQTIYELDHKIRNLKAIVHSLDDTDTYNEPPEYSDKSSSGYRSAYSPATEHNRFRRNVEQVNNSTDNSIIKEFFEELTDIIATINFLSENLPEVYNNTNATNRTVRDVAKYVNNFYNVIKESKREIREINNTDDSINPLYQRLNTLLTFVDNLTEKMTKLNKPCTNGGNCFETKNHVRNKRDTKDSDETSNDEQRLWDGMVAFMKSIETDDESNERSSNGNPKQAEDKDLTGDFHSQRNHLQKELNNLKQQLDSKLRVNANSQPRSSYHQPTNYYQPGYYHQSYYPEPVYYETYHDHDEKDKKGKLKSLKLKKELKIESKKDKIFTKILDKILDKVIKSIPIVIRKLLGLELDDLFGEEGEGYGYGDGYGYGVQKKHKFGIFSIIPMLIFKIFTNISYFVKKLKKNTFIKTFLIPGLITIGIAGLVVFLIWWLSDENYHYYDSYNIGHGYGSEYGGNIGYDHDYRSSSGNSVYDSSNGESRNSQNYIKPPTNDYSLINNNYKNPAMYFNPYNYFYSKNLPNQFNPFSQKPNFNPAKY